MTTQFIFLCLHSAVSVNFNNCPLTNSVPLSRSNDNITLKISPVPLECAAVASDMRRTNHQIQSQQQSHNKYPAERDWQGSHHRPATSHQEWIQWRNCNWIINFLCSVVLLIAPHHTSNQNYLFLQIELLTVCYQLIHSRVF